MENKDFAVFIMVHGRPNNVYTYDTLRKCGYTGRIILVNDIGDTTANDYLLKYKHELIMVDIKEAAKNMDAGDNSGNLNSTLFKANSVFKIAKNICIKYFYIMCDDYTAFEYRYISKDGKKLLVKNVSNMDAVFDLYLDFYKKTNFKSIAFAQGGDFIGGVDNRNAINRPLMRKCMNSFLCSTDRQFEFVGRMNEDVSTYCNLGSRGELFGTIPMVSLVQKRTQKKGNGLTELYLASGTYVKSFFSVMYNPSSVKVSMMNTSNPRIHHSIKWINTTPQIISSSHRK